MPIDEFLSPRHQALKRTAQGAFGGMLMGGLMLGMGIASAALAAVVGRRVAINIGRDVLLAALYVVGFTVAGAIIGLLAPIRRNWMGAFALGLLGAGIVSAVIGLMVMTIEQERDWNAFAFVVSLMTLLFGSVLGYFLHKEP